MPESTHLRMALCQSSRGSIQLSERIWNEKLQEQYEVGTGSKCRVQAARGQQGLSPDIAQMHCPEP